MNKNAGLRKGLPIMTKTTTFAKLRKFVESLGLDHGRGPEGHEYFRQPNGKVLLVLPKYRSNQVVRPAHLIGLRHLLIEHGWVEPQAFDGFLDQKASA